MPSQRTRLFLLAFTLLLAFPSLSQDWKQVYDEALMLYQNEKYTEALTQAKNAVQLSRPLDPKNQAYTLQLLTSICLDSNQPDEGLSFIKEEESLFEKVEGKTSTIYVETLRKHILLLMLKGSYKESLEVCKTSLQVMKDNHQDNSATYAQIFSLQGQLTANSGDLPAAKTILDQSLVALKRFPDAGDDYLNALTSSAEVDRKLKDLASSEKKYAEIIGILEQNGLKDSEPYQTARLALSEVQIQQGKASESATPDQLAAQLLKTAVDFHNQKQYDKALAAYAEAEKNVDKGQLQNNIAFSVHLNFGKALLEINEALPAERQLEKASELCQKLYPTGSPQFVMLDFAYGDLNMLEHRIDKGVEFYLKAATKVDQLQVVIRNQLSLRAATNMLNAHQNENTVKFLLALGVDKVDAISVTEQSELIALYSHALIQSNQASASKVLLQKALSFSIHESVRMRFALALADAYESKGELTQAMNTLNRLKGELLTDADQKAEVEFRIARLQQLLGHYSDAEKGYKNVIASLGKEKNSNSQLLIQTYNSLAVLQTQLGNYDEAELLYTDLLKKPDLTKDFRLTVEQNLATIYEESLQFEKARALLEKVVSEERQQQRDHTPEFAIALQNLATLHQKTRNFKASKQLLEEALRIDAETIGNQNTSYATKTANLGVIEQELGNATEARRLIRQALKIYETTIGKEHPDYMFNAYNLAVLLQRANESAEANTLFKEVSVFYRNQIQELFPAMSEVEKATYFNKINEVILAYLDFAVENCSKFPELKGELFDFRLSTKALLYNASTKIRTSILTSGDTALMARFTEWQKIKENLGKLNQLGSTERQHAVAEIRQLHQRSNELEKVLSEKSASFNQEAQENSTNWKQIRIKLQKGQAAIEIIRLRLNLKNDSVIYAALILRPEWESPEVVIFPNGRKMEGREFHYYRNCIKYLNANRRSHGIYWKPIEEKLSGVHTIFLSSDGVYNKINVLTLFEPTKEKYLLETTRIQLVNNVQELLVPSRISSGALNAALFGRPDFNGGPDKISDPAIKESSSTLESLVMDGVADLPGTQEEVNKINALLLQQRWKPSLFLGASATETAIRKQKDIRVLHIATHGFFIATEDENNPVLLTPDIRQSANNPLLRSGLILSGAVRYAHLDRTKRNFSEDGILTAYEALNLNLDKTELVILSACETGSGEIKNGEGVFGLQRAFMLAGARNMMMSLWKVDDDATQQLMTEFYQQWTTTNDKYEAYHKTLLIMKEKLPDPYYWGGFTMIGGI